MDGISTLFIRGEIVYKSVLLDIFVLEHYFDNTLKYKYFLNACTTPLALPITRCSDQMTGHCEPLKKRNYLIFISSYRIALIAISYTDLKHRNAMFK